MISAARETNEQLSTALQNRIVIEQAKGITALQLGMPMEEAFLCHRPASSWMTARPIVGPG